MACLQIAHAVPHHCLPTLFASVNRRCCDSPFSSTAPYHRQPDSSAFQRLLRLLPSSFHPTVLQACCSCNKDGSSISMPRLRACGDTCAAHRARGDATDDDQITAAGVTADDVAANPHKPDRTSTLFQLLTLLAPVVSRSAEDGCAAEPPAEDASSHVSASSESCSNHCNLQTTTGFRQEPSVKRSPAIAIVALLPAPKAACKPPQWAGPRTTQLVLSLEGDGCQNFWGGSVYESPRWCTALAQLRTLRELSVTAFEPSRLSPPEFGAALQSLPGLQKLSVNCECCSDDDCTFARRESLARLISAVAAMEQLTALSLANCFYLGTMYSDDEKGPTSKVSLPEVSHLSRLTRLTSLAVKGLVMGPEGSDMLVHAVKQMAVLERLHAEMDTCVSGEHETAAQVTLQLCAATELVALTRLELPSSFGGGAGVIGRLLHWIRLENPLLLARLTALNLDCAIDGRRQEIVTALLGLLADLPALRSLSLRYYRLGDDALARIARFISRLTKLDIHGNCATHTGATAVLEAAVRAAASGGEGLRELDISSNCVAQKHVAEVAALLRQLTTLEALNLRSVFDGPGGLQELVPALEALPRLRRLRLPSTPGVCGRCSAARAAAVEPLLAGLGHVQMD